MVVVPVEGVLNGVVQILQGLIAPQFDPPPDLLVPLQRDQEAVEGRRGLGRGGRERLPLRLAGQLGPGRIEGVEARLDVHLAPRAPQVHPHRPRDPARRQERPGQQGPGVVGEAVDRRDGEGQRRRLPLVRRAGLAAGEGPDRGGDAAAVAEFDPAPGQPFEIGRVDVVPIFQQEDQRILHPLQAQLRPVRPARPGVGQEAGNQIAQRLARHLVHRGAALAQLLDRRVQDLVVLADRLAGGHRPPQSVERVVAGEAGDHPAAAHHAGVEGVHPRLRPALAERDDDRREVGQIRPRGAAGVAARRLVERGERRGVDRPGEGLRRAGVGVGPERLGHGLVRLLEGR